MTRKKKWQESERKNNSHEKDQHVIKNVDITSNVNDISWVRYEMRKISDLQVSPNFDVTHWEGGTPLGLRGCADCMAGFFTHGYNRTHQ